MVKIKKDDYKNFKFSKNLNSFNTFKNNGKYRALGYRNQRDFHCS